jgi:hypothetical protein
VMNATTLGRFHYRELNPRCSASSHSLYWLSYFGYLY